MAPKYAPPTVDVIAEDPEAESKEEAKGKDPGSRLILSSRRQEQSHEVRMASTRSSSERHRDRTKRSHKHAPSSSVGRFSTREKPRTSSSSSYTTPPTSWRHESSSVARQRERRTRLSHNSSSDSSSSDEELVEDHRAVLAAARGRLTSPSLISTTTVATNSSGGSSGSNSTVTQASISNELTVHRPKVESEMPISPAVPDPPDVFSFLEHDSPDEDEMEHAVDGNKDDSPWLSGAIFQCPPLPGQLTPPGFESMSSSGSSGAGSFHSDMSSERAADNETDRSTSPERSFDGEEDTANPDSTQPTDPAASKLASQMLAAQHRQSFHASLGSPQIPRRNMHSHHSASKALSPRLPQHSEQRSPPRASNLPITGYDALASKISCRSTKSPTLKPLYRKFEHLNHRLLLHLQDELAELEEQLHILDDADTQSRRMYGINASDIRILPASRRAAAHAGGELEWHRMDLINRIGFKLGQYNQALTSFNKLTQELDMPDAGAVEQYRAYLESEKPLMENETKFLEAPGDLVVIGRKGHSVLERSKKPHGKIEVPPKPENEFSMPSPKLQVIAIAVAVAVLVPILTFAVIPGFLGRITVVTLVASATVGFLVQSGMAGPDMLGMELAACATIYGSVMVVVAGIFG